jgi:hypothetical protein
VPQAAPFASARIVGFSEKARSGFFVKMSISINFINTRIADIWPPQTHT